MLTGLFNESAKHQKEVEFHYSTRGTIDAIGRIATANFQEHKSIENIQKKNDKRNNRLIELLHLQEALAEIKEQFAYIDEILEEIEENKILIREGFRLLSDDDISGMRELLSKQGKGTHLLDDNEVRIGVQGLIGSTINNQQELQDALEEELINFEDNVESLDHDSEEYHHYKAELDSRRSELQKIALKQNLNYQKAEKDLWLNSNVDILSDEQAQNKLLNAEEVDMSLGDDELSRQLNEDRVNTPSLRETKLLFP